MYLESRQGETGFPQQRMQGAMGSGASDYVTMMGTSAGGETALAPAAASAPAAAPAPVMVAAPVEAHRHMHLIVGGALVLGLAFVIYKATRD